MSKHTAGEWRVYEEGDSQPGIEIFEKGQPVFSIIVYGDEGEDNGVFGREKEEALANARLIAAAPELLELAVQVRDNCECGWRGGEVATQAAALIARIEGETDD